MSDRTLREVCLCAAIQLPDGYIVRGHRHHDCLRVASELRSTDRLFDNVYFESDVPKRYTLAEIRSAPQGFLTSHGRFVGREEGLNLQLASGIDCADPRKPGYTGTQLYSEDLY